MMVRGPSLLIRPPTTYRNPSSFAIVVTSTRRAPYPREVWCEITPSPPNRERASLRFSVRELARFRIAGSAPSLLAIGSRRMGTAPLDSTIAVRRDIALSDIADNAFESSSHDDQGKVNSKAGTHKPATASAATDRGVARAAARIDLGRLDRPLSPGASASVSIDAVIHGRSESAPGRIAASKRSGAGAGMIEIVPRRMSSIRAWVAGSGST